jgi:hypothetical protein
VSIASLDDDWYAEHWLARDDSNGRGPRPPGR